MRRNATFKLLRKQLGTHKTGLASWPQTTNLRSYNSWEKNSYQRAAHRCTGLAICYSAAQPVTRTPKSVDISSLSEIFLSREMLSDKPVSSRWGARLVVSGLTSRRCSRYLSDLSIGSGSLPLSFILRNAFTDFVFNSALQLRGTSEDLRLHHPSLSLPHRSTVPVPPYPGLESSPSQLRHLSDR